MVASTVTFDRACRGLKPIRVRVMVRVGVRVRVRVRVSSEPAVACTQVSTMLANGFEKKAQYNTAAL